jgi:hypothetical protein
MVGWKRWFYQKIGREYDTPPRPHTLRVRNEMLKQIRLSADKIQLKPPTIENETHAKKKKKSIKKKYKNNKKK